MSAPNGAGRKGPTIGVPEVRPREASFHTIPIFPEDWDVEVIGGPPPESNLHQIEEGRISDALTAKDHRGAVPRLLLGHSSYPPAAAIPLVRSRRGRLRKVVARLLFFCIAIAALLLATTALSIATNKPWLDPRPRLLKALNFASQKLRALPKLRVEEHEAPRHHVARGFESCFFDGAFCRTTR